jgi:hypothetical protein
LIDLLIGVYVQLSSIATLYVKLALGGRKAGILFVNFTVKINVMFRQFKEKNKNLLRLKLKSALKIEQISVVL